MENELTMASLFDGSGAFPLAAMMTGIKPIWSAEIEPFPCLVTEKRLPFVKHYGDVSKIKGNEVEPVHIITFGSPCQSMSVAGKREGLRHADLGDEETTRSGLFMEAVRIIKEMRNGRIKADELGRPYGRIAIWENVPGAYSSSNGADFKCVLESLASIKEPKVSIPMPDNGKWQNAGYIKGNGWEIAWRTLDAQYWGVAQRRRRCYLVADFDSEPDRNTAFDILFKREGLSRNFTACNEAWQATSGSAVDCADEWRKGRL